MSAQKNNIPKHLTRGSVGWMASNPVAANLLMVVLMIGGIIVASQVRREVFPYFEITEVTVSVTVSGATPEEMEKSVAQAIEEAVQGLDGVEETTANITTGSASVIIEGTDDVDGNILLQDVKAAVDRITTFPVDAERPTVSLRSSRREAIELMVAGNVDRTALRYWAELIKEDLIQDPAITQVELENTRDHEVWVEVSQETLRRYGLTMEDVSRAIGVGAVQQGGGSVNAASGDILLRLNERRDYAADFANIAVRTNADGSRLLLDDIATITDTFDDTRRWSQYNGQDALSIEIYSLGNEDPTEVAEASLRIMDKYNAIMPGDLRVFEQKNMADVYKQRKELMTSNALMGVLLVFLCLSLFLRPSLAFWVSLGIPVSILGAFWFFVPFGISLNVISMFAFIITLGIVVDDAIVVGENVGAWLERGVTPLEAAIKGTKEVAGPVTFSVLTNMISFMPMLFIPGTMGKVWMVIPLIVVAVFICSLIESVYVLPAHLSHLKRREEKNAANPKKGSILLAPFRAFSAWQERFSARFMHFVQYTFGPFVGKVLHQRYVTVAIGLAILAMTAGYVASGRLGFDLMPRVESDYAFAQAVVPSGTSRAELQRVTNSLVDAAQRVVDANGGDALCTGIQAEVKDTTISVLVHLVDPDVRPMSTEDVTQAWRKAVGMIPGVESLVLQADRGGPGSGSGLTVRLSHRDTATLEAAAAELGAVLATYGGVSDVDLGTSRTMRQFDVRLTPLAEQLGFTSQEVSHQLRYAFEGVTALRQQRGNSEMTVRVRLPEKDRMSEATFEELILRAPSGQEVLMRDIVQTEDGQADSTIRHTNGRRTATVTANITPASATGGMMSVIEQEVMPGIIAGYDGLSWEFGGRQSDMADSTMAMVLGLLMALLGIYALLAIPFKSYTQPLIIMLSIPFGIVGAVAGHLIMGYSLSVISLFGIVALSGVVVNDSLVLIDFANKARLNGMNAFDAVQQAAIQRARPILLTTLTTFLGLMPIIFETSRQAKFLIPVALSLGFGILFATFICLLLVPAFYLILDDVHKLFQGKKSADTEDSHTQRPVLNARQA